ncbi:hypothetical protein [Trinickia dabaoshanensis]|nr:hypothetical protein [Trinickia dabaoshanensis]
MPKVSSSSGYAEYGDVDHHEDAAHERGDENAGAEPAFSRDQGAHLQALGPRRERSSEASGSGSTSFEPATMRRRRAVGERRHRQAQASTSESHEAPEAGDANAADPGGVGQLARRAARATVNGLARATKIYVGLAAVSTAYRAARNPRDIIERPLGVLGGGISFAERVDEHTVAQGRADVIEQHGNFIPPDSACYGVTPRIVDDMSMATAGNVERRNYRSGDWRPTDMRLNRFAANAGGRHAVHHEYLHCFTHQAFVSAFARSPHAESIEEALTEHFADRLPGHAVGKLGPHDFSRLSNGKRWATAAAELERAVGSDTLQRAYFSGDADAIRAVTSAAVNIWPQDVTNTAWRSIKPSNRAQQQRLAECFVGAALLATGSVPPEPTPGSGNDGNWAMDYLPVATFSRISPTQAEAIRMQAGELRAQLGTVFDQAFYGFDRETQGEAMAQIRDAIHAAWKPVL